MATQTNLLGYFGKAITTKRKSQSNITSFFKKADQNQKNDDDVVYVEGKKELGLTNSNCMLEQNYDFNALLTSYEKYNKTVANFYLTFNRVNNNDDIKIHRKNFPKEGSKKFRSFQLTTC